MEIFNFSFALRRGGRLTGADSKDAFSTLNLVPSNLASGKPLLLCKWISEAPIWQSKVPSACGAAYQTLLNASHTGRELVNEYCILT